MRKIGYDLMKFYLALINSFNKLRLAPYTYVYELEIFLVFIIQKKTFLLIALKNEHFAVKLDTFSAFSRHRYFYMLYLCCLYILCIYN